VRVCARTNYECTLSTKQQSNVCVFGVWLQTAITAGANHDAHDSRHTHVNMIQCNAQHYSQPQLDDRWNRRDRVIIPRTLVLSKLINVQTFLMLLSWEQYATFVITSPTKLSSNYCRKLCQSAAVNSVL